MILFEANYVEGRRIDDVWREVMWLCIKNGNDFVVKGGSYVGQIRRQLPFVTLRIKNPGERPLSPIMPPNMPPPTSDQEIDKYFAEYLMDDKLLVNEQYRYSSWIKPQLPFVIELLKRSNGNTNQACISVGDSGSAKMADPPCLRMIGFNVIKNRLQMTVVFRSWDLVSGLPQNLGGLQLLKEYVFCMLDDPDIFDGDLIAISNGLHIYEQYFDLANCLNSDKIVVEEKVLNDKNQFGKEL
jgi:thymidylate synthase